MHFGKKEILQDIFNFVQRIDMNFCAIKFLDLIHMHFFKIIALFI